MIRNELSNKKPLSILEKIEESLERLNDKIEIMIEIQKNGNNQKSSLSLPDASLDVMTLLSMPDHLRKTAMVICRCSRATAESCAGGHVVVTDRRQRRSPSLRHIRCRSRILR